MCSSDLMTTSSSMRVNAELNPVEDDAESGAESGIAGRETLLETFLETKETFAAAEKKESAWGRRLLGMHCGFMLQTMKQTYRPNNS